jgi:dihydropteroate synthase
VSRYYRPLIQHGAARPDAAHPLCGRPDLWFTHAEQLSRNAAPLVVAAERIPGDLLHRLTAPRQPVCGLDMALPQLMGILNVTPDSFSDGGVHAAPEIAHRAALDMVAGGAALVDIGGESTRPGAALVARDVETARTAPVIAALRRESDVVLSIDTRKSTVALAALDAGAGLVNDVSGFTFDAALAPLCARRNVPVCVMHAQGSPERMQASPRYDNVTLEVFDFLLSRIEALEKSGISRARILVDPGIGFGKTFEHNLTLLQNLGLFHGLGCVILLGASRKGFIGAVGQEPQATARFPGSVAVALAALAQGVQILRVHDVAQTAQAVRLWQAVRR